MNKQSERDSLPNTARSKYQSCTVEIALFFPPGGYNFENGDAWLKCIVRIYSTEKKLQKVSEEPRC